LTTIQPDDIQEANTEAYLRNVRSKDNPPHYCQVPKHLKELLRQSTENLNEDQHKEVAKVLMDFQAIFSKDDVDLGRTNLVKHHINTGNAAPLRQPYRRLPRVQQEIEDKHVTDVLEKNITEPSSSPWASPIVLLKHKDGGTRFFVDYRRLNLVAVKDVYPLPRIDDTLDSLTGSKYFSTLDLTSGYWQVDLDQDAKEKSAFTV